MLPSFVQDNAVRIGRIHSMICMICGWELDPSEIDRGYCYICKAEAERKVYRPEVECQSRKEIKFTHKVLKFR